MKTQQIELYKFSELPENVQNKLIEKRRISNGENWCYDLDYEFKYIAEELGFIDPKFDYSIGYSQSDFFNFEFSYIEEQILNNLIFEILGKKSNYFIDTILQNYNSISIDNYSKHYKNNYILIETNFNSNNYPNIDIFLDKLADKLKDIYNNICEKCIQLAYNEIEYVNSEELAREQLEEEEEEIYLINGKIL